MCGDNKANLEDSGITQVEGGGRLCTHHSTDSFTSNTSMFPTKVNSLRGVINSLALSGRAPDPDNL